MRENIYITITDIKGSKHYTVNQVIKKYILYLSLGILLVMAVLGMSIVVLKGKAKEYNNLQANYTKEYNKLESSYKKLVAEKEKVLETVETKERELENLNGKLSEIENILNSEKTPENISVDERLEVALLTAAEKTHLLNIIPSGRPIDPFNGYTSRYGTRIHPVLKTRKTHWGLDFKAKTGTTLLAAADGIVKVAGDHGTFGKLTIISHAFGFETYYAHQSKINVKVGDIVYKGQKIGAVGTTGRSTGPHLHYEIHHLGKKLDPMNFTEWNLKNYNRLFEKETSVKWQSLIKLIRNQYKTFQWEPQQ